MCSHLQLQNAHCLKVKYHKPLGFFLQLAQNISFEANTNKCDPVKRVFPRLFTQYMLGFMKFP
jgi:hypothetical protein